MECRRFGILRTGRVGREPKKGRGGERVVKNYICKLQTPRKQEIKGSMKVTGVVFCRDFTWDVDLGGGDTVGGQTRDEPKGKTESQDF